MKLCKHSDRNNEQDFLTCLHSDGAPVCLVLSDNTNRKERFDTLGEFLDDSAVR